MRKEFVKGLMIPADLPEYEDMNGQLAQLIQTSMVIEFLIVRFCKWE